MTLSIIAADPAAGVVGAAVTSCVLAVGPRVLHVRPAVGAVVTQASSEITWGAEMLDELSQGRSAQEAIAAFAASSTQLAGITADGAAAAHTGTECSAHAGHRVGRGVCAQVNTAMLPDAAERIFAAFDGSPGPLAERMVAALAACGGDARGEQSAALQVCGPGPFTGHADEPHVDLRVDDHRQPVEELARLLSLHRAHCAMRIGRDDDEDRISILATLLEQHPGDPHLRQALERARRRR